MRRRKNNFTQYQFAGHAPSAQSLEHELEQGFHSASEICVLTSRPFEGSPSPYVTSLQTISLQRLGLATSYTTKEISAPFDPAFRFHIHLPDQLPCTEWWESTLFWMQTDARKHRRAFDRNLAVRDLLQLEEAGSLRLYVVPPYVCGTSTIILNPREHTIRGFNPYFHRESRGSHITIARMDTQSIEYWKKCVFIPLELGTIKRLRVRCRA